MFFMITGASGGGKSVAVSGLQMTHPQIAWYDFDDISVPPHADKKWRQQSIEKWLQIVLTHQARKQDVGLCGQAPFGELLASPSAPDLTGIAGCLLDCGDVVRIDRLRGRNTHDRGISQEMLNWAAWHRMHAADPQWRQDVIQEDGAEEMQWERWSQWQRGDSRWNVWTFDTSSCTIEQVIKGLSDWVAEQTQLYRNGRGALQGQWWET